MTFYFDEDDLNKVHNGLFDQMSMLIFVRDKLNPNFGGSLLYFAIDDILNWKIPRVIAENLHLEHLDDLLVETKWWYDD